MNAHTLQTSKQTTNHNTHAVNSTPTYYNNTPQAHPFGNKFIDKMLQPDKPPSIKAG